MPSGVAHEYDIAEAHFGELSDRQHEVLGLVARGYTNPEIAERLGVTLDGAKWHVSELLGKLGLDSREELAEFWAWRQRPYHRSRRVLRGVLAVPAFKIAGAIAGVALIAGIGFGAWGLFAGGSGDGAGGGIAQPFVLEATVAVDSAADNAQPGEIDPTFEHTESHLQWWYESSDTWKWQVTTNMGQVDQQTLVIVSDDGQGTAYNSLTNTYSEAPLQRFPDGTVAPPALSTFLGPVGYYAKTADGFVAMLRQQEEGEQPREVSVVGDDTVLGRHTVVVQMPAGYSTTSDGAGIASGTMRMWLDPERMVVLKVVSTSGDQRYTAQVTSLDWDARLTAADVGFQPPEGARKTAGAVNSMAVGTMSGSGGPRVDAPAGFVVPAYVPDGLVATGISRESTVGTAGPVTFIVKYAASQGGTVVLTVQETLRADGLPDALKTGTKTKAGGHDAWSTRDGGRTTLVWQQDRLAVEVTGEGIKLDELVKMAESMEPGAATEAPGGQSGAATAVG